MSEAGLPLAEDVLRALPVAVAQYTLESPEALSAPPAALVALLHESLADTFVKVAGELARRRKIDVPAWDLADAWSVRVVDPDRAADVPPGERVWLQAEGITTRAIGRGDVVVGIRTHTGSKSVRLVQSPDPLRATLGSLSQVVAQAAAEGPVEITFASPYEIRREGFDLASACRAAALSLLRRAVDEQTGLVEAHAVKDWAENEAERIGLTLVDVRTEASLVGEKRKTRRSKSNAHRFSAAGVTGSVRVHDAAPCGLALACLVVHGGRWRKGGDGDVRLSVGGRLIWPRTERDWVLAGTDRREIPRPRAA